MWYWIAAGYLIGGINGAYVITKYKQKEDITQLGSGTGGARNAGRTGGKSAFVWTVTVDAVKTILPMLLALYMSLSDLWIAAMIVSLVGGHIWSIWLKGKGGKGVVVYLACALVLEWPGLLIFGGTALVFKYLPFRFSKMMMAAMVLPVLSAWMRGHAFLGFGLFVGYGLVVLAHRFSVHPSRMNEEEQR